MDNKNQRAFPNPASGSHGLTKREYFAVSLLQGMIAAGNAQEGRTANRAIEMADTLLEKLGKENG
jgi:hypothetical protein